MRTDDCPPFAADRILAGVRDVFSDVADKWAFLIIDVLGERTLRCGELRKKIDGISHKMLTQNLRMLERNGLVERSLHPTVPPHVEHTLTEPGRALRVTVMQRSHAKPSAGPHSGSSWAGTGAKAEIERVRAKRRKTRDRCGYGRRFPPRQYRPPGRHSPATPPRPKLPVLCRRM